MNQPQISIIIPTLNEEQHIDSLLASLRTLAGVEIIVSDGGSSDSTTGICRRYPVKVINSQRGRGIQFNTGAENARGEIYLFLHADSLIEAQVVEDIRAAVAQGYLWGCCNLIFNETAPIFRAVAWFSNLRARIFSSCYGDQAIFCHRDLFWQIGGFPRIVFLEDLELSLRLRQQQKAKIIDSQVVTSTRRFRTTGIGKTIIRNQMIKLLHALGFKPEQLRNLYQD